MSISTIVLHTPIWVWVLFIFLISRGIQALAPREMTRQRMLVLPILFFAWAIYDIATELTYLSSALGAFVAVLVMGGVGGWFLGTHLPPARLDPVSGLIHRPGTPMTLILVSIGFAFKYALSIALAHQPGLATDMCYSVLYGAVSGGVDGIFWGLTLLQLSQTRNRNGKLSV